MIKLRSEGQLLRRIQPIATRFEIEDEEPEPEPEPIENVSPRIDRRQGERRQGERRGMDTLRAEALQAVISRVEDRNFNGLRDRFTFPRLRIPPSRIALIVLALVAGGTAAFLATQHEPTVTMPVTPAEAQAPAPTTGVLVAKAPISVGQTLTPDMLKWQDWPNSALSPDYITNSGAPDALSKMAGQMVRGDFVAGEPIRQDKLVAAGGGYLSSILEKGMRGVSVSVSADSASGGFVVPSDRVDVVLTRQTQNGGQDSATILTNVQVLAINAKLSGANASSAEGGGNEADAASAQAFANTAIATLELNPKQAQVIINASTQGKLSLMLRPASDVAANPDDATNAQIRLSSPFWTGGSGGTAAR
ncbi:MAG TPA: Flp pilus assembly protein CpaB [Devosia sp.]|jgi:pilus assembly protein CpaB|nr:Flp pilus assembly protein CpaB [Devosia sp.]